MFLCLDFLTGEARFQQLLDEITLSNKHIGMNLLYVSELMYGSLRKLYQLVDKTGNRF